MSDELMDKNRLERIREIVQHGAGAESGAHAPSASIPPSGLSPPLGPITKSRRPVLAILVLAIIAATSLGAWWWSAGSYRRFAESALARPIATIEYQQYLDGPFLVLHDHNDIAQVKKFLLEAKAPPVRIEPGVELPLLAPLCEMRIRFSDGRTIELRLESLNTL
jgi:hypothetical protein